MPQLDMLPAWAGRIEEPKPTPAPPLPPRRYALQNGAATNGVSPHAANGQTIVDAIEPEAEFELPLEAEPEVEAQAEAELVLVDDDQGDIVFLDVDPGFADEATPWSGQPFAVAPTGSAPTTQVELEPVELEPIEPAPPAPAPVEAKHPIDEWVVLRHQAVPISEPVAGERPDLPTASPAPGSSRRSRGARVSRMAGMLLLALLILGTGVAAGYVFTSLSH
jgi:hypothetical protein